MAVIDVSNLTFSYDGSYDNIFEDVSFQIDTDWKIGFIGRNGRGKTTFLKLLMGNHEYHGKISANMPFDYFPFEVPDNSINTLGVIEGITDALHWEIERELSLLHVANDVLARPFSTLSHGEQTKVLLAALFLNDNHFLLVDEPTNHLDTDARTVVGNYLNTKKGFILVSHDRQFLDHTVDHVLSINKTNIDIQKGNFSTWWENKRLQDNYELAENQKLKSAIKSLSAAAKQTGAWADKVEKSKNLPLSSGLSADKGAIGHKAAKMMKRSKVTEARMQKAADEKSKLLKNIETADELTINPLDFHTNRLAELRSISISYGGRQVCCNIGFDVMQGDRIAVTGKNGCGKSSLLKLILGQPIDHCGKLALPKNIEISYVPQDAGSLHGNLKDFAAKNGLDESRLKSILRKLDFSRTQFEKDMADFSAGQKKKVLLAQSLCTKAHLYIWDEPLNYIDVLSRIQIEDAVLNSAPTMIFVEHDSTFVNRIATKTAEL